MSDKNTTGIDLDKLEICAKKGGHVSREDFLALISLARQAAPEAPTDDQQAHDWCKCGDDRQPATYHGTDGCWLSASPAATTASASSDELTDLEARQQVAEALGLGRSIKHSFAWSYLLGIIKDCSKDDDEAQAAHAGAVEKDAARYRALRDLMQNAKGSASIEVNQHLAYYDQCEPGEQVKLQWYPDTPIGSYTIEGYTLDDVADQAIATSEQKGPQA